MLEKLTQRFWWTRLAFAVHERVNVVGGGPFAASIALVGFLSLFPLMLVGVAVVGHISAGDVDFAAEVVDFFGLEGTAAREMLQAISSAEASRRAATVVGFVGLLWAGLGIVGTLERALNATWQITGRGVASRLIGVGWLVGAGLLLLASIGLGSALGFLPGPGVAAALVVGVAGNTLLYLWTFVALTNVRVRWRAHLPGALAGGIGFEILKVIGGVYVPRLVASSSALYGSLGVMFAVLIWLVLAARLVVYASALNVVLYEARHGTVTVDIQVPHIKGKIPLEADRGGAVTQSVTDDR